MTYFLNEQSFSTKFVLHTRLSCPREILAPKYGLLELGMQNERGASEDYFCALLERVSSYPGVNR